MKIKIRHRKMIVGSKEYNYRFKGGMIEKASPVSIVVDTAIILIMCVSIFVSIVPMWHVLMSSISNGQRLLAHSGLVFMPIGDINWGGYKLLFADLNILRGYTNTIIYVIGSTAFGFVINVLGGYFVSRPSMYNRTVSLLIMFTLMFGGGLIPTYLVIRSLGWVGTMWAIIIPGCTNAAFLLVMANAFRSVPESTVEAAQIDGAGHLTTMFQVILPQALSLATVTVLFSVIGMWNSWYPASIYVPSQRNLWPLQLWVKQIVAENVGFLQTANPDYNRYLIQYAVIVAATAPILGAFPFFLKYIEKGVLLGSVKE